MLSLMFSPSGLEFHSDFPFLLILVLLRFVRFFKQSQIEVDTEYLMFYHSVRHTFLSVFYCWFHLASSFVMIAFLVKTMACRLCYNVIEVIITYQTIRRDVTEYV